MKLHKEGKNTIIIALFLVALLAYALIYWGPDVSWYKASVSIAAIIFYALIVRFFRVPKRDFVSIDGSIMAPADGEIVVVEKVFESEYLKEECFQISVFMSPNDVHINWFPFKGTVKYFKYHPGKHLVAWHPKASKLNERTSICLESTDKKRVMIHQVAGAIARRIVCYAKVDHEVEQNDELGFIKFGSRVDLYIPLSAKPIVKLEDKVIGGVTPVAKF